MQKLKGELWIKRYVNLTFLGMKYIPFYQQLALFEKKNITKNYKSSEERFNVQIKH